MKFSTLLATALVAIIPSFASAQLKNAAGNANVSKVENANKNISSMQCSFSRTIMQAAISESVASAGTFYYVNPSNISMKYNDGENLVVTAENVSLSVGGKQRTLKSGNRHVEDLAATLLACVQGKVSQIEGTLASAKTVGKNVVFKINSELNVGRAKVSSIEVAYDSSDLTISSIKLIEKDGSYQLYELSSKSLNKPVDSSVFAVAAKKQGRSK